jgi:hypothetical protein
MINILKTCICICEISKEYTLTNLFFMYLDNKEIYCILRHAAKSPFHFPQNAVYSQIYFFWSYQTHTFHDLCAKI